VVSLVVEAECPRSAGNGGSDSSADGAATGVSTGVGCGLEASVSGTSGADRPRLAGRGGRSSLVPGGVATGMVPVLDTDPLGAEPGREIGTGSLSSWCETPPGFTGCGASPTVADEGSVSRSITCFLEVDSVKGVVGTGAVSPSLCAEVGVFEEGASVTGAGVGAAVVPSEIGNPGAWSWEGEAEAAPEAGISEGLVSTVCGTNGLGSLVVGTPLPLGNRFDAVEL
jgi:hypothetical protein